MTKKTILVPSFPPPSIRSQSNHDRLDMLLNLHSLNHDNRSSCSEYESTDDSKFQALNDHGHQNFNSQKPNASSARNDSSMNLFDGDISYNTQAPNLLYTAESQIPSSLITRNQFSESEFSPNSASGTPSVIVQNTQSNMRPISDVSNVSEQFNQTNTCSVSPVSLNSGNNSTSVNNINNILRDRSISASANLKPAESPILSHLPNRVGIAPVNNVNKSSTTPARTEERHTHTFSLEDFNGMNAFCRNVGSAAGFSLFQSKIRTKNMIFAVSLLFTDLTSTHVTTSIKYCTPSQRCHRWYCNCERNIRCQHAYNTNILGIVVVFGDEPDMSYFLSLLPTADEVGKYRPPSADATIAATNSFDTIVLRCQISLLERWRILLEITNSPEYVCMDSSSSRRQAADAAPRDHEKPIAVIYNYQVFMLTVHAMQKRYDFTSHDSCNPVSRLGYHECFKIFDPRLASYLCKSSDVLSEQDMELTALCKLYNIEVPPSQFESSDHCPINFHIPNTGTTAHNSSSGAGGCLGRVTKSVGKIFLELNASLKLYHILNNILIGMSLHTTYHEIEIPLASLLSRMEVQGVHVSTRRLAEMTGIVRSQLRAIEKEVALIIHRHNCNSNANVRIDENLASSMINLSSPEQVANLLFDTLQLVPPSAAHYGGSPKASLTHGKRHLSTSEEDLLKIKSQHPVVQLILNHRALNKSLNTYLDGLKPFLTRIRLVAHPLAAVLLLLDLDDQRAVSSCVHASIDRPTPYELIMKVAKHRHDDDDATADSGNGSASEDDSTMTIHAVWNQTSVRTGRLSCCRPNLQSIPNQLSIPCYVQTSAAGEETIQQQQQQLNLNVRQLFTATPTGGWTLIGADYSQIEVRILAHLSSDPGLLALFRSGEGGDVYRNMAAAIFKRAGPGEVTADERQRAKTVCLGVIYGMGAVSMAARLGIEVSVATQITTAFFQQYRHVQNWMTRVKAEAREKGYVTTIYGRRRYVDMAHGQQHERAAAERQAVNSIVQGSASEVIKLAMLLMDRHIHNGRFAPPIADKDPYNAYADEVPQFSSSSIPSKRNHDLTSQDFTQANARLLMQIHDELIFEVQTAFSPADVSAHQRKKANVGHGLSPEEMCVEARAQPAVVFVQTLRHCMEVEVAQLLELTVPLVVNVTMGDNWADMAEVPFI